MFFGKGGSEAPVVSQRGGGPLNSVVPTKGIRDGDEPKTPVDKEAEKKK